MTAPESQPLTEEERYHLRCRQVTCIAHPIMLDHFHTAEIEAMLATRTAALLDRLKAAEKRAGVADRERRNEWETQAATIRLLQERADHAEADKARAVAETRGDGYVLALREVAAAYVEQAPNGVVKTTDLILWLQEQADAFEAREEASGS